MAAEVAVEAVLQFFRQNGLWECESALMEDIVDKSRVASSDDEFVSLASPTTADFTNPYGIHTMRAASEASSDRLSQFGTARDYPDFDMQNDLFWYKENDEDYLMPPLLDGRDFDGHPSEDKFVMSQGRQQQWALDPKDKYKDYYDELDFQLEESNKMCACCNGYGVAYADDHVCLAHTHDFNSVKKESEVVYGEPVESEVVTPDEETGAATSDEFMICDKEDDFEIFNLRIVHRKNRTGFEENKEFPIVLNSVIAGRYYVTEILGSAAFSRVVQAHDLYSGMEVCLKIIKNDKDFFDQSLDEIKLLKFVNKNDPADQHHVLRLYDYFYHQEHLFIVTELLRANLYEFQKYNRESGAEPYFTMQRLQVIIRQCLEALLFLHDLGIVHCDLKPENILIKSYGGCEVKVIDLGSSCFQTDHLSLYVQSRSYRAPEVMLGLPYDNKIDLWSVGCILAELYSGEVLFPNEAVVLLLASMVAMLGPIDTEMLQAGQETNKYFTEEHDLYYIDEETNEVEYVIPEETTLEEQLRVSDGVFVDFVKCLLQINPARRLTATQALHHPWLSHNYQN